MLQQTDDSLGKSVPGRANPEQRSAGTSRRRSLIVLASFLLLGLIGTSYYWFDTSGVGTGGGIATLKTADFHALAFSPNDPNLVFFGHHNGVMQSRDGGRNWRPLIERPNFDAMGLATNPVNLSQIYVAGHLIFQISNDGGKSWNPIQHDLPYDDIHGFAIGPDDPKRLYAFVVGYGLFGSMDGGQRWIKLSSQLSDNVMTLTAAGGNPEVLYAGGMGSGLMRSIDGGRTWVATGNTLPSRMVNTLALDPVTHKTIFAGTDKGLFKSMNGGSNWARLPLPGNDIAALAISPSNPNVLLAISVEGNMGVVFRSEDGGASWGSRR